MKEVTVGTSILVEELKKNREAHIAMYEKAYKGYKAEVIKVLKKALKRAQEGKEYKPFISLIAPENHKADYDSIIRMLELSADATVVLDAHDHQAYVMDNWTWKHAFVSNSLSYIK